MSQGSCCHSGWIYRHPCILAWHKTHENKRTGCERTSNSASRVFLSHQHLSFLRISLKVFQLWRIPKSLLKIQIYRRRRQQISNPNILVRIRENGCTNSIEQSSQSSHQLKPLNGMWRETSHLVGRQSSRISQEQILILLSSGGCGLCVQQR
jgi:hypothetical protein